MQKVDFSKSSVFARVKAKAEAIKAKQAADPNYVAPIHTPLGYIKDHALVQKLIDEGYFNLSNDYRHESSGNLVINGKNWSGDNSKLANKLENARYTFGTEKVEFNQEMLLHLAVYGFYGDITLLIKPKKNGSIGEKSKM